MAHTNQTPNYELSQFLGTDKPAWLVDYNGDMEKIDLGLKAAQDVADAAKAEADQGALDIAAVTVTANAADAKASGAISDLSDAYDATSTYNVGDYVIYNNLLYRCTTNITVPESFDGNHWTRTTVEEIAAGLNNAIAQLRSDVNDVADGSISSELSGVRIYNNRVHKNMKVVHLYALMDIPALGASGSWIASIPSEFRPSRDRNIVGVAQDGTTKAFDISSNGHLRNAESVPNKTYYFDAVWML